jgi:hypothetical protein
MIETSVTAVYPGPSLCNKAVDVCEHITEVHLVDLMPSVLILAADGGVLVQQQLTAVCVCVSIRQDRVIQCRQTKTVSVVRRRAELQQGLKQGKYTIHHSAFPSAVSVPRVKYLLVTRYYFIIQIKFMIRSRLCSLSSSRVGDPLMGWTFAPDLCRSIQLYKVWHDRQKRMSNAS